MLSIKTGETGKIKDQTSLQKECYCCHLVPQSGLTLCNPMDCSPPGSFVHGMIQGRILELVAISFSGGSFLPRDQTCISCISRPVPGKRTKRMESILNVALKTNKHSVKYRIVILNPSFTFKTLGELLKMLTFLAPYSVMI